jgi:hypothetical protein
MELRPPLFFVLGIPRPKLCRLPSGVGGVGEPRECVSNRGTIKQQILDWEEARRLRFEMIGTDMRFRRHVSRLVDSFDLQAVSPGVTRVTRTTEVVLTGRLRTMKAVAVYLGLKAVHRYVFRNWALLAPLAIPSRIPTRDELRDDWSELAQQRGAQLEALLGDRDDQVYHALIPLQLGGTCDVLRYRHYVAGVAYVTSDLTGIGQPPNRLGTYELMICTREDSDWAAAVISQLGPYTLKTITNPGDTMDMGSVVPAGSTISALLFTEPDVTENEFRVGDEQASLLLCIGITSEELAACQREGADQLLRRLRDAGVFPYTELSRKSVC